jgi:hypothetical protein
MPSSAPTIPSLQAQLAATRKRVSFAWAKYYEATNADHHGAIAQYNIINTTLSDDAVSLPTHIKEAFKEMSDTLKKKWDCPICADMIPEGQLDITNCGHFYCKPCLVQVKAHWAAKPEWESHGKWECGVCRRKHKLADGE